MTDSHLQYWSRLTAMPFCQSGVGQTLAGLPPTTDLPFLDFLPEEGGDAEEDRGMAMALRGALAATATHQAEGEEGREGEREE